tara:strand:- start:802 stop:1974 length:1173 start_codon:yes stop_codon:yes gene_type:complete
LKWKLFSLKKAFKYLLFGFLLVNLLIFFNNQTWIYKAINITYLKGYASSYINDFVYFPSDTIKAGKHQKWLISKNYNVAKSPEFINSLNKSLETVAFMIIKNDSIQHEKYWSGYSADSMSNSFSMSKSWVSTLIGVAIKEGDIESVDQKVCDFLPEFCVGKNSTITIKNLLTMSSGLNWEEDYYNPIGQTAQAYYGNNLRELTLNLNAIEDAGKVFKYHSSCTQILTFLLEKATTRTISEYASEKLWKKLGAKHSALWSKDSKGGDEKGFCCINSNARDFARLARLYMSCGNWNGIQILDSSYVKNATSSANLLDINGKQNKKYGYQFWIEKYNNMHVYYARGFRGQYMICIPEKDMIIIRLGRNEGELLGSGHFDSFYAFIDAAIEMYP